MARWPCVPWPADFRNSRRCESGEWFAPAGVQHLENLVAEEVRRSFNGTYSPLYQVAYMIGGLQFRALNREMVGAGKMPARQFHDTVSYSPHPYPARYEMLGRP